MNTPQRRYRPFYKTPLFIFIILAAITLAGVLIFVKISSEKALPEPENNSSTSVSNSASTNSSSVKPSADKSTESSSPVVSNQETDGKTPEQYDGENPNLADSLSGNITYSGFSGNNFLVRVNIDQYLSSGTCNLVISDGNNQIAQSAPLIPEASTSTCQGFDIPKSEIEALSNYIEITINLTSGDKSGMITGVITL